LTGCLRTAFGWQYFQAKTGKKAATLENKHIPCLCFTTLPTADFYVFVKMKNTGIYW